MQTKVVHCKKEDYDIYIGRGKGCKWGNPFSHKENTTAKFKVGSRKEAIDAYREWITKGEGQHLLNDLDELKGKVLGCWCKPKSCHGDVLVELIENRKYVSLF
jgi:hypothetical protein